MAYTAQTVTRLNKKRQQYEQRRRGGLRQQIDLYVDEIHRAANTAKFQEQRIVKAQDRFEQLRAENIEQAELSLTDRMFYVLLLHYPLAVVVLDVLFLGAFTEHMLSMRFDPDSLLIPVGTIVVPLTIGFIEIVLAKGISYAREQAAEFGERRLLSFLWVLGLCFALAMPMFIGGLYYLKIVQMGADTPLGSQVLVLIGLVFVSFAVHALPLFIAEAVANATAWLGYAVKQSRCGRTAKRGQAARYRAAMRAETAYRVASNLVERYNSENPERPIEALTLSKVAADLINNIQEGSIDYELESPAPGNEAAPEPQRMSKDPAGTARTDGRRTDDAPPADPAGGNGGDSQPARGPDEAGGASASASGFDDRNNNSGASGEANYWRDIVESQTRDRDGEVS
ncbi:MAG TPA: hypothetical protein VJ464_12570 [Blastocatellia bacterium]|nr:hypothetical protein [Blastocatellia bacterium]